jgi:transposase
VENRTETLDFLLVQTLLSIVKEDAYYKVKEIKEAMAENFDEPQKWLTTKWIGNALRRLGFTEKRRMEVDTNTSYHWTRFWI